MTAGPAVAARNGEEAVVEYLLLCRCQHLVHNWSGIPRVVLEAVVLDDHRCDVAGPGLGADAQVAARKLALQRGERLVGRERHVDPQRQHRTRL